MSESDRDKWNRRYAEGAYADRVHPSAFLAQWTHRIKPGRALDVASGAGRNSLWLAEQGFAVDSIDISARALDRLQSTAQERGLPITTIEHDLDDPLSLDSIYDLIIMVRYNNLPLLKRLSQQLAPGGWLLCEEHMLSDAEVIGPTSAAYRVASGALVEAVPHLEVVFTEEGVMEEPDGRKAALSRMLARRLTSLE